MAMSDDENTENAPVFSVEKVVDSKIGKDGHRYYKVKWVDSWEPEEHLEGCIELINEYWERVHDQKEQIVAAGTEQVSSHVTKKKKSKKKRKAHNSGTESNADDQEKKRKKKRDSPIEGNNTSEEKSNGKSTKSKTPNDHRVSRRLCSSILKQAVSVDVENVREFLATKIKEEPASDAEHTKEGEEEEEEMFKRTAKLKASYCIRKFLEKERSSTDDEQSSIASWHPEEDGASPKVEPGSGRSTPVSRENCTDQQVMNIPVVNVTDSTEPLISLTTSGEQTITPSFDATSSQPVETLSLPATSSQAMATLSLPATSSQPMATLSLPATSSQSMEALSFPAAFSGPTTSCQATTVATMTCSDSSVSLEASQLTLLQNCVVNKRPIDRLPTEEVEMIIGDVLKYIHSFMGDSISSEQSNDQLQERMGIAVRRKVNEIYYAEIGDSNFIEFQVNSLYAILLQKVLERTLTRNSGKVPTRLGVRPPNFPTSHVMQRPVLQRIVPGTSIPAAIINTIPGNMVISSQSSPPDANRFVAPMTHLNPSNIQTVRQAFPFNAAIVPGRCASQFYPVAEQPFLIQQQAINPRHNVRNFTRLPQHYVVARNPSVEPMSLPGGTPQVMLLPQHTGVERVTPNPSSSQVNEIRCNGQTSVATSQHQQSRERFVPVQPQVQLAVRMLSSQQLHQKLTIPSIRQQSPAVSSMNQFQPRPVASAVQPLTVSSLPPSTRTAPRGSTVAGIQRKNSDISTTVSQTLINDVRSVQPAISTSVSNLDTLDHIHTTLRKIRKPNNSTPIVIEDDVTSSQNTPTTVREHTNMLSTMINKQSTPLQTTFPSKAHHQTTPFASSFNAQGSRGPKAGVKNGPDLNFVPDTDVPQIVRKYIEQNYDTILETIGQNRNVLGNKLLVHRNGSIEIKLINGENMKIRYKDLIKKKYEKRAKESTAVVVNLNDDENDVTVDYTSNTASSGRKDYSSDKTASHPAASQNTTSSSCSETVVNNKHGANNTVPSENEDSASDELRNNNEVSSKSPAENQSLDATVIKELIILDAKSSNVGVQQQDISKTTPNRANSTKTLPLRLDLQNSNDKPSESSADVIRSEEASEVAQLIIMDT